MQRSRDADRFAPRGRTADALLIDGLGTLVSLTPPAPVLQRELALRCGVQVTEDEAAAALAAEIGFYRAHMGLGRDADSLQALRHRCAEVLRGALPPNEALAALEIATVTDALLGSLRFQAFPDARPALTRARLAGARVIVVSNWDVSLLEVLEVTGLAPLVDAVITSAAIGQPKPAAAIFSHALSLAGVPAHRAVHVGDNLAEDVAGALGCGIRPVLIHRDGGSPGAVPDGVQVITSLSELGWT
jgi:HAD superfamily hydrolase (TIGR01549 family)